MILPLLLAVLQAQDPWPFRPLSDAKPPVGVAHPVDAFVDARLKKAGITPAPEAAGTSPTSNPQSVAPTMALTWALTWIILSPPGVG